MSFVKISGNSNCAKEGLLYVKDLTRCKYGLSTLGFHYDGMMDIDLYKSGGEIAGCFVQSNGAPRVNISGNESLNAGPHTMICYKKA